MRCSGAGRIVTFEMRSWSKIYVSDKVSDYQLRVALSYLHAAALAAEGRNTARAPAAAGR